MFNGADFDRYLVELVGGQFVPVINLLATAIPVLLGLIFGILTLLNFVQIFTAASYGAVNLAERQRGWKKVIGALIATGFFTGLIGVIDRSSNTFFTRRVNGLRLTTDGLKGNIGDSYDAIYALFVGIGVYAFIRFGLKFYGSLNGDQQASKELFSTFMAGVLLVNAQTVTQFIMNTFNIRI